MEDTSEKFMTFDEPVIHDKMPTFLKVLCILTFVGCGIGLIGLIYTLAAGTDAQATIDKLQNQPNNSMLTDMITGMEAKIGEMNRWMTYQHYVTAANILLCLGGALLMWKRRKTGFYLYAAGQIVTIVFSVLYYNVVKDIPFLGVTTLITFILTFLVYAAFIVMYGANLKHMR
jgi:hypothetical protein